MAKTDKKIKLKITFVFLFGVFLKEFFNTDITDIYC